MSDNDFPFEHSEPLTAEPPPEPPTPGLSSIYRLFEAFIMLREKNERQHKLFEQSLAKSRDALVEKFNSYVGETQRAYQRLRQELVGESKRIALAVYNELLEVALDLARITSATPPDPAGGEHAEAWRRWAEGVEIEYRKVESALHRHGIHRYDAVVASPYDPKLHERVGSRRTEGMGPGLVAAQVEHGYASDQPDFVLRRPKVIVSD